MPFSILHAEVLNTDFATYISLIYADKETPRNSVINFSVKKSVIIGDVGRGVIEMCSIKKSYICIFAEGEIEFAVPRNEEIKVGQQWIYRGRKFKITARILFPYSSPMVKVFVIQSFNKQQTSYYYSKENGLVGYTSPIVGYENQSQMVNVLMPSNIGLCGIGCKEFDQKVIN